ncbi:MAG: hypothetical protein KDB07_13315, partial [Planctomycetes bacterium]|nr:hypothetical protein [Planctomycetota bacterium]
MSDQQSLVKEMEELINNGQYSEVENIWMEAATKGGIEVKPFLLLADLLAHNGQEQKSAALLELLVEPLIEADRAEDACQVVASAARFDGAAKSLIDTAKKAYSSRLSDAAGFEEVVAEADAKFGSMPKQYVAHLESLCSYKTGDFLYHEAGWGLGEVVGLDLKGGSLLVSFDNPPQDDDGEPLDPHTIKLEAATNFFKKIPSDHLLARKRRDLDGLKDLMKNQPDELIRIAMRSLEGKVDLRRLKGELIGDVVPKTKWASWWNETKAILVGKGELRMGKGNNPSLELLLIPTSLEDEYRTKFAACHTPVEMVAVMHKYLKEDSDLEDRSEFLSKQLQGLFDLISSRDPIVEGEKILGKFLLDDVREAEERVELEYPLDIEAMVADDAVALRALVQLKVSDYEIRLLEVIRDSRKDWADIYCKAMLKDLPDAWGHIEDQLRKASEDDKLFAVC